LTSFSGLFILLSEIKSPFSLQESGLQSYLHGNTLQEGFPSAADMLTIPDLAVIVRPHAIESQEIVLFSLHLHKIIQRPDAAL